MNSMLEGDFSEKMLNLYDYSGPHSLWDGMSRDSELSIDVINTIFSHYMEIISEKLGVAHPLNTVLQAYKLGGLIFFCSTVDSEDMEVDGLPLPSTEIVDYAGGVVPVLNIGFEDFNNLLNGIPELVASLMQFLYLNFSIMNGLTTVYTGLDGDILFDDATIWGTNYTSATTLIALEVAPSRYSTRANNQLSIEQRHFYSRLVDEARRVWDVPTDGPFVLN